MTRIGVITIAFSFIGFSLSGQDLSNHIKNISDYDFQTVKNFILLNDETRTIPNSIGNCSNYWLFNSDISATFELITNCKGWSAIRVITSRGGVVYDYYLNHEYQKKKGKKKSIIVLTTSFGYKTDTLSLNNFYSILSKVKASLLDKTHTNQLVKYLREKEQGLSLVEQINPLTLQVSITKTAIAVTPSGKEIPPYEISLVEHKASSAWNYPTRLNPSMDSMYFLHLSTLFLDLRKGLSAKIR